MSKGNALILGSSSGFGWATAEYLASRGYNIFGVHFDRAKFCRETLEPNLASLRKRYPEQEFTFFNTNAAAEENIVEVCDELQARLIENKMTGEFKIDIVMHSLAFGTLKPMFVGNKKERLTQQNIAMTINVMGTSLVTWVQELYARALLNRGSHIVGMTSEGNQLHWPHYGAVSQAKVVLESTLRQLAVEMAPLGIRANAIQAGVTDTPALRKIPGHKEMLSGSAARNPTGVLTTPEKVAKAIWLLSQPEAAFISGNVIRCDGGEAIAALSK